MLCRNEYGALQVEEDAGAAVQPDTERLRSMTEDNSWPSARFADALAEPDRLWGEVKQELLAGKALPKIGRERGFPVLRFCAWVSEDEGRAKEFEAMLPVLAQVYIAETVSIADGEAGRAEVGDGERGYDPVARDALRVKTRFTAAEKLDPGRWSKQLNVNAAVALQVAVVNYALGPVAEGGRVVENAVEDASESVADISAEKPICAVTNNNAGHELI